MSSAFAAPALAPPTRHGGQGRQAVAARPTPAPTPGSLGILRSANAAPLPVPPPATARGGAGAASGGGWSVQVGAFASESVARSTAQQARDAVHASGSRTVIQPVHQGRNTLYRARVVGLSRESAEQACNRMRSRGQCSVLAPGTDF